MITCPNCHEINSSNRTDCFNCHTVLQAPKAPAKPRTVTRKVCSNCGASYAAQNAQICAQCGYRLESMTRTGTSSYSGTYTDPARVEVWEYILCFFLPVIGIVLGCIAIGNKETQKGKSSCALVSWC